MSYPSTSASGAPVRLTGLVHLPHSPPPADGWPVVSYGHMTTGGAASGAPSTAAPGHPEWRRISQGDALCERLLARGVAVLRPDYEGLGSPGVHPYLIGDPLATSVLDMVAARRDFDPRLGDRWVSAGHSEGSVAALFTARSGRTRPLPLRGVAAFTPVTRMDLTIGATRRLPVVLPACGILSALIALMIRGATTASARVAELVGGGGLSTRAEALWPHLDERCASDLAQPDSFGGLPPAAIGGRHGGELFGALFEVMRANEVRDLHLAPVPVRIDAGWFDEVAPAPLTRRLMSAYRTRGVDLTTCWWPSHHSGTMQARHAPSAAADWIVARLAE
ncbi:MAG TPA: lipase family protein [Nocardioides sp.]|uniref:alpha/beta hydrolase n=1 Tax=Nocardioides sp. TaxID=35761 RepID=UPI002D016848|nr:hypothetical protein [Nocardioides sp.]HQR26093.1 lipase family protein [Nocardioides sp.]